MGPIASRQFPVGFTEVAPVTSRNISECSHSEEIAGFISS
jgi:hypothetical protein